MELSERSVWQKLRKSERVAVESGALARSLARLHTPTRLASVQLSCSSNQPVRKPLQPKMEEKSGELMFVALSELRGEARRSQTKAASGARGSDANKLDALQVDRIVGIVAAGRKKNGQTRAPTSSSSSSSTSLCNKRALVARSRRRIIKTIDFHSVVVYKKKLATTSVIQI